MFLTGLLDYHQEKGSEWERLVEIIRNIILMLIEMMMLIKNNDNIR